MSTNAILVSVIIPHFNDLLGLHRCLSALEYQTLASDKFEIIVADNNSNVDFFELEKCIAGRAKLTQVQEQGAGPARNGGVQQSCGRFLAFTDSDCIPNADWLEQGVRMLSQHSLIGGKVSVSAGKSGGDKAVESFERVFAFNNERYVEKLNFSVTANLFCRRGIFDEVGPFSNGVSEDKEWCWRAANYGHKIKYCAEAAITHPPRSSWIELKNKWSRIDSETFALTVFNGVHRVKWMLRSLAILGSILPHSIKIARSSELSGWRIRASGILILARIRCWRASHYWCLLFQDKIGVERSAS